MDQKTLEITEKRLVLAEQFDATTEGQTREILLWLASIGRQKLIDDQNRDTQEIDELIPPSKACRILGCSLRTLKAYCERYGLTVVNPSKQGKAQRYSTKDVLRVRDLLDERETELDG